MGLNLFPHPVAARQWGRKLAPAAVDLCDASQVKEGRQSAGAASRRGGKSYDHN